MNIKNLESYGTERYFVLSEIEQKSTYVFLDEPAFGKEISKRALAVNYILFDLTKFFDVKDDKDDTNYNENNAFKIAIHEAFVRSMEYTSDLSHFIVFVELLIPNEAAWETCIKNKVEVMLITAQQGIANERIDAQHGVATTNERNERNDVQVTIIFGVTDNVTGTPALSEMSTFLDDLSRCGMGPSDINIVGNRSDLMGFDHTIDPDTSSNIFQVLCYEDGNGIKDILVGLVRKMKMNYKHLAHMAITNKTLTIEGGMGNGYEGTSWDITWIHIFLTFGSILAYYMYTSTFQNQIL